PPAAPRSPPFRSTKQRTSATSVSASRTVSPATPPLSGCGNGPRLRSTGCAAVAHVSCRLVPGQDPAAVLARISEHVRAHPPAGVQVRVDIDEARVPAYTIAADHPAIR